MGSGGPARTDLSPAVPGQQIEPGDIPVRHQKHIVTPTTPLLPLATTTGRPARTSKAAAFSGASKATPRDTSLRCALEETITAEPRRQGPRQREPRRREPWRREPRRREPWRALLRVGHAGRSLCSMQNAKGQGHANKETIFATLIFESLATNRSRFGEPSPLSPTLTRYSRPGGSRVLSASLSVSLSVSLSHSLSHSLGSRCLSRAVTCHPRQPLPGRRRCRYGEERRANHELHSGLGRWRCLTVSGDARLVTAAFVSPPLPLLDRACKWLLV